MKTIKKTLLAVLTLLVFYAFNLPIAKCQGILLPLDIVIVGFDKEINDNGDDFIILKNLVDIVPEDYFEISNTQYDSSGTWNRAFNNFISYELRYKGFEKIKKNSLITLKTNTSQSVHEKALTITVNNLDYSREFDIVKTSNEEKITNDFLTPNESGAIYLHQGNWFEENNNNAFLGNVIHGLTFSENTQNTSWFEASVKLDASGINAGENNLEECDPCLIKETVQSPNHWSTINGTPDRDVEVPTQIAPIVCECTGEIFIENSDCVISIDSSSTFNCQESIAYDWIITNANGVESILLRGIHYGILATITPLTNYSVGNIKLKVYCDECTQISNELSVECPIAQAKLNTNSDKNESNSSVNNFRVYPNPADYSFSIEFESSKNAAIQINIFSRDGKEMLKSFHNAILGMNKYSIDSGSFPSGIYVIQVVMEEKIIESSYLTISR